MKLAVQFLIGALLAGVSPLPAHAVIVQGTLLYEKIPATTRGLVFSRATLVPAPQVTVELWTSDGKTLLRSGNTDDQGVYLFKIPGATGPARLIARSTTGQFTVLDP